MTAASTSAVTIATANVENHPLVDDVNAKQQERLSETERLCRKIADYTGAPLALLLAIVVQIGWLVVGTLTHWDPYPFVFLLTCSNVLQLVLIFVIAVAQKQQTMHDEIRAECDHNAISRLLYHHQVQDDLLLRLAERAGIDTSDIRPSIVRLQT
jgi:uncharacterized membrane protein